jgi:hypothetical protein
LIINPYSRGGNWLKGNLHTHTENSTCGHYSLEQVLHMYKSFKMKYDFLAITDHCQLTEIGSYVYDDEMILFAGTEYKAGDFQTLGINIGKYEDDQCNYSNHQQLFDEVEKQGGINIICHPHAFNDDYWPAEKLLKLSNYTGIEIFNNNVKYDNKGRAVAVDLWDELLSNGKRVFGFANDDMHIFQRCGGAFNLVLAPEKSSAAILEALKRGSFYGSTGILLDLIDVDDSVITVNLKHTHIPAEFTYIGHEGRILKRCYGISASYDCTGTEGYIRVEVKREDGAAAWTQPFWIE